MTARGHGGKDLKSYGNACGPPGSEVKYTRLANALTNNDTTSEARQGSALPLAADLDGTLIYSDMLWESLAVLRKRNILWMLMVPVWFLRGRAFLKQQVARRATVDVATLAYNQPFMDYLRAEKARGRRLILASASDRALVEMVARHVGLFDEVYASDGKVNLRAHAKRAALEARFGLKGFDYAGNSTKDIPVWMGARNIIVVNAPPFLVRKMRATGRVVAEF